MKVLGSILFFLILLPPTTFAGTSPGQMGAVAVSPDGKLVAVAFQKDRNSFIYKISVETGIATRLTNAKSGYESSPSFSADGKRIVFTYSPGADSHSVIVLMNIDGSDAQQWPPSDVSDISPILSPDNKTIVFSRSGFYGSYSPMAQPHHHAWRFYASDLDGKNVRQLTNESFYMASPVSISPDSKSMVVVTEGTDTPPQIAIYSLDRPGQPTLSLRPHVPKEDDRKNPTRTYPNYMPDGKSILFMAASKGKHGYDYDVYRLDLETNSLERLTTGNGYATDLKVSADGKTAVFLKWRSDSHETPVQSELYLLDLQTRKLTPVKVGGLN
ncbi:MAG: TolB family protein [Candidatus Acidiferrales bacterium]